MLLEKIFQKREERENLLMVINMFARRLKDNYHQNAMDKKAKPNNLESIIISTFNEKAENYGFEVMN